MLIEYAEDDDLDVIGRNLAVNRLPFVKGDDQYRAVIKALAYNPRATVYGLELLMDALVGAGNYEIFEDLIQHNNTVFIRILPSAGLETREAGKMFLGGAEFPKATTQTKAVLSADPVSQGTIQGAPFRNEDVFADFRGALPSALTITDFDGDTGTQVWNWQDDSTGLSEGSGTNSTADYVQLIDASGSTYGYYEHFARVIPESRAQLNILMQISSWTTAANQYDRMVIGIEDGAKNIRVGFGESGGNVQFGFITDASTWIGSPVTYDPIAGPFSWSEFTLIKDQEDQVVLLVNGNEVLRTDYANFPSSTNNRFVFGPQNTTGQITVNVKQAGLFSNTVLDFWSGRDTNGVVSTANPDRLDFNITNYFRDPETLGIFPYVGNKVEVRNSQVTNAQGGNNNGAWLIKTLLGDDQTAELEGIPKEGATVDTTNPTRITVPGDVNAFQFPDDLGKKIVISGSELGNDGTYTISDLLHPGSFTSFKTGFNSQIPEKTNVCVVTSATFTTEANLDYQLDPNFVNESNVEWELSDAAKYDPSFNTLTVRHNFPLNISVVNTVLAVNYSRVLSGQLMPDNEIWNAVIQDDPLLYEVYPFYLVDPLGAIRGYLDDVTAAGVIPDYKIE
jgi:hypothetical protein